MYINYTIDQIEEKMELVMSTLEDLEIFYFKRLLRNVKYLFPEKAEEINPSSIRLALLKSKTMTEGANGLRGFQGEETSKFETFQPGDLSKNLQKGILMSENSNQHNHAYSTDQIMVDDHARMD